MAWSQRRGRTLVFSAGLVIGTVAGGVLVWLVDWRSLPSGSLDDARRASRAGRWDVVAGVLARHLRRFPSDGEAQVLMARAEAAGGDLASALGRLDGIPRTSPWIAEARLRAGQLLHANHAGARAEAAYRDAIEHGERAPGWVVDSARLGLVQLFGLEVRYDEARAELRELLRTSPDRAAVLALCTMIEAVGTEPRTAIAELEAMKDRDPADFNARRALAHHYLVLGRTGDARALLDVCRSARPDDPRVAETLAQCLLDSGEPAECRRLLDELPPRLERGAWYWCCRGILEEREGDGEAAASSYAEAVRVSPADARAHHRLGLALERMGRREEASRHIERSLALRSASEALHACYAELLGTGVRAGGPGPDAGLCYRLGACSETLELPEARDWYRESLARSPGYGPSAAALARLGDASDAGARREPAREGDAR